MRVGLLLTWQSRRAAVPACCRPACTLPPLLSLLRSTFCPICRRSPREANGRGTKLLDVPAPRRYRCLHSTAQHVNRSGLGEDAGHGRDEARQRKPRAGALPAVQAATMADSGGDVGSPRRPPSSSVATSVRHHVMREKCRGGAQVTPQPRSPIWPHREETCPRLDTSPAACLMWSRVPR